MSRRPAYHEELLHWVWSTARVDLERLQTADEDPVTVFNPGTPNHADGPDFLNAHLQIDNLNWHGDVEIHWQSSDWFRHGHHHDSNYNRVILHIVWNRPEARQREPLRSDGSSITTLCLKEFVTKPLRSFIDRYQKPGKLPCSGHFSYISESAFIKQLEKAEEQYFERKVDDLLAFWDPSLPPSQAWLKMLAVGLCDGLGISHNRLPMQKLCRELYPRLERSSNKTDFLASSLTLLNAQLEDKENIPGNYRWSHKGSRPANQPETRVPQAASCLWYLYKLPFQTYLSENPLTIWRELHAQVDVTPGLGRQRRSILLGTVWLPAFFILADAFAINNLKQMVLKIWREQKIGIPKSLLKPFEKLNLSSPAYRHSLGTVHQLRAYCRPRHCKHCEVFKSAISS